MYSNIVIIHSISVAKTFISLIHEMQTHCSCLRTAFNAAGASCVMFAVCVQNSELLCTKCLIGV